MKWRVALFAMLLLAAVIWLESTNGEHTRVVRHFLRNLARQLF